MEEIAHRLPPLPTGSMTQCNSLAGGRMGSSSSKSEFLAFCEFKPYVDLPNFWWVFYSWNINPENREWWWKQGMMKTQSTPWPQSTALLRTAIVTDLWLSFKYSIELQNGLLLGSPPLELIIYSGLPSLNLLSNNFCPWTA